MTKLPESDWDSYLSWLEDFEYGKLGVIVILRNVQFLKILAQKLRLVK